VFKKTLCVGEQVTANPISLSLFSYKLLRHETRSIIFDDPVYNATTQPESVKFCIW